MQMIPIWLQRAFCDSSAGRLYLDGGGNYRLRPSRRIVSYNRQLTATYPDNRRFHEAAQVWLSLWECVPTARFECRAMGPRLRGGSR
jgi:hypothetical protein